MIKPIYENNINGGWQKVYRFDNGYGASVVCNSFSYGHESGLMELAVLKFDKYKIDSWDLCYDTPITDDVLGYLNQSDVEETLSKIEAL